MYLYGIGGYKDISMAISNFERAVEGEHYEAASILAHIYMTEPKYINKLKAYKNLDYASQDPFNMNAKLMLLAYFYENSNLLVTPLICGKITKLISELQLVNEVDVLYNLGHKTFYFNNLTNDSSQTHALGKIIC